MLMGGRLLCDDNTLRNSTRTLLVDSALCSIVYRTRTDRYTVNAVLE